MDIELAVNAMELAGHIDHMVLFSGDGDFRSLVEAVQRRGVRVTVVSTDLDPAADDRRRVAPSRRTCFSTSPSCSTKIGRDPASGQEREPREPQRASHAAVPAAPATARAARVRPAPAATTTSTREHIAVARRAARRDCARAVRGWSRFRKHWRERKPGLVQRAGAVVRRSVDARLLIVGLAPGLQGANRTGRPFTGDYAGVTSSTPRSRELSVRPRRLRRARRRWSDADRCAHHAMRCAACRPRTSRRRRRSTPAASSCRPRWRTMPAHCRAIVALGRVAHDSVCRALGVKAFRNAVRHGAHTRVGGYAVRQLSLLALQHEYRRSDAGYVSRCVSAPCAPISTQARAPDAPRAADRFLRTK